MQVIGKMADGTVLVALPARVVELLSEMTGAPSAQPQPVAPAHKVAAKLKAANSAAGGTYECRKCGKEFERKPNEQRQFCSPECLAAFKREYARKKYYEYKERKKNKVAQDKPPATALNDEEFRNKRIAMIRNAAQKEI